MAGPELLIGASLFATLASAGVGAASAAGAFGGDTPDVPEVSDPAVEDARRRQLIASRNSKGRQSTILTNAGSADPLVARPTLLGGAAAIGPGGPQPAAR